MAARIVNTTCIMDCPDACALEVTVDGDRVEKIEGAREGFTGGYICSKVSRYPRRLYHRDRLLHPMRRTGPKGSGEFVRIPWDDALSEISERFQEIIGRWGGEAILPYHYGGSNGLLGDGLADDLLFSRIGASRLLKTVCAAPSTAAAQGMYGRMPGVAFGDYEKASMIIVWGANPKASNIHLVPVLKRARESGAFLAVVDPQRNFSRQEVDLHLQLRPGTDLPVALAMIRYWHERDLLDHEFLSSQAKGLDPLLKAAGDWSIEQAASIAGVEADRIEELARRYAEASPAVIRCGWGMERNRNGGQAIAAVLAMPALLGKFGVPGGGYTMSNKAAVSLELDPELIPERTDTRALNMTPLGELLTGPLSPPIQALFVYNCNPVATIPDQNAVIRGLSREDLFVVLHEQVFTDTAPYADLLLPATTFLEQVEVRNSYGDYKVGGIQPAIEPMGEAWPNEKVFSRIGRAMGLKDAAFEWDSEQWWETVCRGLRLYGAQLEPGALRNGSSRSPFNGRSPVAFKTIFPGTPDRKINLTPAELGDQPYEFLPVEQSRYPLALISPATSQMISSTLGEFNLPEQFLDIDPRDASERGLSQGDQARVFNELGEVVVRVRVSSRVRPGVVMLPKGAWRKASRNGSTATALCPASLNKVGGGACFNDARVEVVRMEG